MPHQRVLPLKPRFIYNRSNWRVGSYNSEASDWIDKWPDWQNFSFVCIWGPKGSGKTHLAHLWCEKTLADWLDCSALPNPFEYENSCTVLEDIDKILTSENQEWLFHFYNEALEKKRFVLITAESPPACWEILLPDLRSRLKSMFVISLHQPPDSLFREILQKNIKERGLFLSPLAQNFLLGHIDRSFPSLTFWINQIDQKASEQKRNLTLKDLKILVGSILKP